MMNRILTASLVLAGGLAASAAHAGHYGYTYSSHYYHAPAREVHYHYYPAPRYHKVRSHPHSHKRHHARYHYSAPPRHYHRTTHYRHTSYRSGPGRSYVAPRSAVSGNIHIRF